ncbi:MAG: Electron transport complex protein rnfB [Firmicutes bacterium ADurb.Bin300]|jgi:electron transport complex protein RnfB|nr:MAG: Electron transport complex protein rnfB [Firmicutes bacterium ADurb.Bin300]
MNDILSAVLLVSGLGVALGLALAIASRIFAVPVDEKAESIADILPGANCGFCGFSGCSDYAAALSSGKTDKTNLCNPGGNDVAAAIADILGVQSENIIPTTAFVHCNGNRTNAKTKMLYSGVKSCQMANQLFGGNKECEYGCLGLGDCVAACQYDAIRIVDGIARIDPLLCRSCKACIATCPKGLISLVPLGVRKAVVLCMNHEKGGIAKKQCNAACIGCMRCEKVCEAGAVKVNGYVAYVDTDKCTGCGKCHEVCPVGCIEIVTPGVMAVK